jgi:RNA polymerase sigma factor (TIGR02999 family)
MADLGEGQSPGGDQAAAELLPELYTELRRLATALTARLRPGQTLQPTALVHEAYLRLVGRQDPGWEGRRHFFGAAARAMREILIEQARRKGSHKHGGRAQRVELSERLVLIRRRHRTVGQHRHTRVALCPRVDRRKDEVKG